MGAVIGVIGLVSLLAAQPLLAPSIASAAFVQVLTPRQDSAKPWPIFVGQMTGLAGALASVFLVGAAGAPPLEGGHPVLLARVVAAALAVAVTVLLQRALKAPSPAGGATAALIALGTESATLGGCIRVFTAILLVAALGEAARLLVLRARSEQTG